MEENLAEQAVQLYSEGDSFGKISDKLDVSKSRVGGLIRKGIEALKKNNGPNRNILVEPEDRPRLERMNIIENAPRYANPNPGAYVLETSGVPKRIVLTPKALMIFNIWQGSGFEGDLSDFIEDSIIYLYETMQPGSRGNFR